MKVISNCRAHGLVLAAALGIGLGFVTHASAQERSYLIDLNSRTATDLGSLTATAINDAGQVVGDFDTDTGRTHAFITGPNGVGMTDLGTLGGTVSSATGVNAAGQVAGWSNTATGRTHAFITSPNGMGMTDLGTLGGTVSSATGINATGQVVGSSYTVGPPHAFITGANGVGMTDLGTLGGYQAEATDINAVGQVVGQSAVVERFGTTITIFSSPRAFITGPNGVGMTNLGVRDATGINDAGQVVGSSSTYFGPIHAFITGPNGVGMTDLGTVGGYGSGASGINASGQVVGWSFTTTNEAHHAFITGPNGVGMTDLNSLVDLPAGVFLTEAIAINNMGQVIAQAVPEPQSYGLMLAGLALMGAMVRRKQRG
jgi:probable HAF family extracellular repeat protein